MGHEHGRAQTNGSRRTLCPGQLVRPTFFSLLQSRSFPVPIEQQINQDVSVCIAGIVRIPLLAELKLSDVTWTSIGVGVWINVECNIGILSACLPILRPLFSTKYSSSPISYLTRILRTITSSSRFTSSHGDLSSDPEKGAVASEPSSDATMVEGLKWPNDDGTRNWRWSRNNSDSKAMNPRSPAPRQTEKEREKKYRTWYSAAADVLPEIDLAHKRGNDGTIDADKIPRYRDDVEEKPLPDVPKAEEGERTERDEQRLEVWQQRHSDALQAPSRSRLPKESRLSSQRSSWGLRRDTWNLMPSVVYWDKDSLMPAMILR